MSGSVAQRDNDPVRQKIMAAMDRLLAGEPLRSSGRLSVSQLAVEADVGRWQLTHQHVDLKEQFQARVRNADGAPAAFARQLSDHAKLQRDHTALLAHCVELEERLATYASVIQLLVLEREAAARKAPVADIASRRITGQGR
ncbi:hypothetical protein ACJEIK_02695 [Mycobacterium sp. SMC-16]|jgi:hypothetical protein|uniref:hypothetical protein n=1 Tax=Mycobacterium sp. SMC-16 TaxID=3385967 RepID=UPI0011D3D32D|nr:MAG: hypothetical protein E6R06_12665 [Mycobacterium sp.]